MDTCPDIPTKIESEIDRVLTQYRESPNLLHLMRTYLEQVGGVMTAVCELPSYFDLDTARGEQLTFLGQRLGFPRCHCVCSTQPVFGFGCEGVISGNTLVGFCEATSTWLNCGVEGLADICLDDDELYRSFLKVRRYQMLGLYDLASLTEAAQFLWGPTAAILDAGHFRVVVAPGRPLTEAENLLLQLYARVFPLAPGVEMRFHFAEKRVFGFGEGWGGFAEEALDMTQQTEAYSKTSKVFGFCEDDNTIGGFCAEWEPDGLPLVAENSAGERIPIVDEEGRQIMTGPLTADPAWLCRKDSPWMCEINVHPYTC